MTMLTQILLSSFVAAVVALQPVNHTNFREVSRLWPLNSAEFQHISKWDLGNVTDLSQLFALPNNRRHRRLMENEFQSNRRLISGWNVSNVDNMAFMFAGAAAFNQDLSSWNTHKVMNFSHMFAQATSFTSDLSGWNTQSAVDMTAMFWKAENFDSNLNGWNTDSVKFIGGMFYEAPMFTGKLCWSLPQVEQADSMFSTAEACLDPQCASTELLGVSSSSEECVSSVDQEPVFVSDEAELCYAGENTVFILGKGEPIEMRDLRVGDHVMVSPGKYERVFSFGHYAPEKVGQFLDIRTESNRVILSEDHLVFTTKGRAVPASTLRIDDFLWSSEERTTKVISISRTSSRGLYAPFTSESGTILVGGILGSNFVTLQKDQSHLCGVISWHHLGKYFSNTHRLACMMYPDNCKEKECIPEFVSFSLRFARYVLSLPLPYQIIVLSMIMPLLWGVAVIEWILCGNIFWLLVPTVAAFNLRWQKAKNTKMK